jgi:hypothetical protein
MKILFKSYATKSDIRELMGGANWKSVKKVFDQCKILEKDTMNIRPSKVPSLIVFKVLGINYNFALKQYKESIGKGVESWTSTS